MEIENEINKNNQNHQDLVLDKIFDKLRKLKENYTNLGDDLDLFLSQFSLSNNDKSNILKDCLISQLDIEMIDKLIFPKSRLEEFINEKTIQMQLMRCRFIHSMISRRIEHDKKSVQGLELQLNYFQEDHAKLKEEFNKLYEENKNITDNIPTLKTKNKNAEKFIDEFKYSKAKELDEKYLTVLKKYEQLAEIKKNVNDVEKKIDSYKNFPIQIVTAKSLINSMKIKSKELDDELYKVLKK